MALVNRHCREMITSGLSIVIQEMHSDHLSHGHPSNITTPVKLADYEELTIAQVKIVKFISGALFC